MFCTARTRCTRANNSGSRGTCAGTTRSTNAIPLASMIRWHRSRLPTAPRRVSCAPSMALSSAPSLARTSAKVHVGMELSVPRKWPDAPWPCQEIPGYWTCYTVSQNGTLYDTIAPKLHVDPDLLERLNFGPGGSCPDAFDPTTGEFVSQCGNATACPFRPQGYFECMAIGRGSTLAIGGPHSTPCDRCSQRMH
jgi:hypothetical protein